MRELVVFVAATALIVAAVYVFPLPNLLLQVQPQHEYFPFAMRQNATALPGLPQGGEVTGAFDFSTNAAGVSVDNAVDMTLSVRYPFNVTRPGTGFAGVLFTSDKAFDLTQPFPQSNPQPLVLKLSSSDGYTWTGSEKVVFYASGLSGGTLSFADANGSAGLRISIPPVVDVQGAAVSAQFANTQVLTSLELVIAALIMIQLRGRDGPAGDEEEDL